MCVCGGGGGSCVCARLQSVDKLKVNLCNCLGERASICHQVHQQLINDAVIMTKRHNYNRPVKSNRYHSHKAHSQSKSFNHSANMVQGSNKLHIGLPV